MAHQNQGPQMLTANRLVDGDVLYWKGGGWVGDHCFAAADCKIANFSGDGYLNQALGFGTVIPTARTPW